MVETKTICLLLKQSRFVNTFCFFGFHFNFMCLFPIIILNYRNWNNKFSCKAKKRSSMWLRNLFLNKAKYLSGQNLLPITRQSLSGNLSRVAISALLMVETKTICLLLKQNRFVKTFCFLFFSLISCVCFQLSFLITGIGTTNLVVKRNKDP